MQKNTFLTSKERKLRAYRGLPQDRAPVAPEFWNFIGAKTLGVSMETFERENLLADGLCAAFKKYGTEGWCIAFPTPEWGDRRIEEHTSRQRDGHLLCTTTVTRSRQTFTSACLYDSKNPSWIVKHWADSSDEIPEISKIMLSNDVRYDTAAMTQAWKRVGEACLCEVYTGEPFFDFIVSLAGFENAVEFFSDAEESELEHMLEEYTFHQVQMIDQIIDETPFESFFIGCSCSCNSLIGPNMWRRWDKPYIRAIAEHLHRRGKLLHVHFHGRSIMTVEDFAELGIDCVCPFERGPGGDINTPDDLAVPAL